ncbi:hypothetical protein EDD18DRAFT_1150436, partial [Armillaria luteobubalina]
ASFGIFLDVVVLPPSLPLFSLVWCLSTAACASCRLSASFLSSSKFRSVSTIWRRPLKSAIDSYHGGWKNGKVVRR